MSAGPIDPPARLLMGPGPITVYPRVLQAMSAQLVGQYDPFMTSTMNETQALYREVFDTDNAATLLVDGTSRAGIEAALVSLIAPGDRVLVPRFGRFGHLLVEIAERSGAEVHTIDVPWGQVFDPAAIEAAIREVRPKLLAVVHGDTSTTVAQPLDELGAICREHDVLFYSDTTATLGGNEFRTDAWGLDAVTAGLQKCLGGPSGSAPITLSERAVAVDRVPHEHRGGHPERGGPGARRPHPLELLRPRPDPRLLGTEAAEPPHRGGDDALLRTRVRAHPARGGDRRLRRPSPPARRRDARRACWDSV